MSRPFDLGRAEVWETEGRRGAAERGWLGPKEQERELERQREEYLEYLQHQEREAERDEQP